MTPPRIYALTLSLLTGTNAPQGPGWYVVGTINEGDAGEPIGPYKVNVGQAQELGRAFGSVLSIPEGQTHPFEVVAKGTEGAKEMIQEKLDEAERVATTVGILRKALGEFNE